MNANCSTAFGTCPFIRFVHEKPSDTKTLNIVKIFNHTHVVLGSVSLVQTSNVVTREFLAFKTKLHFAILKHFAVLDCAVSAGDRFVNIVNSATTTTVSRSQIRHANSAIHSAGRYKQRSIK